MRITGMTPLVNKGQRVEVPGSIPVKITLTGPGIGNCCLVREPLYWSHNS